MMLEKLCTISMRFLTRGATLISRGIARASSMGDDLVKAGVSPVWEQHWQAGVNPGDRWDARGPIPVLQKLLEENQLPKGSVLVPGCGRGYDVGLFGQFGYDAIGVDLSPTAVERATQYIGTVPNVTGKAQIKV